MSTTNLLHVDASILGSNSVSRRLTADVVEKLAKADPGLRVIRRDLAAIPIPHLTGRTFAASQSGDAPGDPALQADLALGREVLDEFLAADVVVLGLGLYNFGIPSQLKAWVDRIAIAGKTFAYTDKGPVGLAGGKRVIVVVARGGFYGAGSPSASFEHGESYLRSVFAFFGITDLEVVVAEGLAVGPESRAAGIAHAEAKIAALGTSRERVLEPA